jgi:hypothetical protein
MHFLGVCMCECKRIRTCGIVACIHPYRLIYQVNVHKPFYSYTNMILPKLLYFARYNVALSNCAIGDSCVIHNGVCIGQDGKA